MIGPRKLHSVGAMATASRFAANLLVAAAMTIGAARHAAAAMTIDGDARAMTVTVAEVTRREVTDEIARRFKLGVSGAVLDDGPVSGRFRGDLGDVLAAILTSNSFLIVYEGGKPARLLLSERGPGGAAEVDPTMRSLQPNGGTASEAPGEGDFGDGTGGEGQVVDPSLPGVPLVGEEPPEPQL